MKTNKIWFAPSGLFVGTIPPAAVRACSQSGDCLENVRDWIRVLGFSAPREKAVLYLKEFGAWDDFNAVSDDVINERVFRIACNDIKENGDFFGLIN